MTAKFEIYKGKIGDFYWKLVHTNGRVIAKSSEGYASRVNAINSINSVRANVSDAAIVGTTKITSLKEGFYGHTVGTN